MANPNLVKQIQYYLSEDNLANDQFFYKEVASNPQHFVKIDLFLKCNKVKKLGVSTTQQIIDAVKESEDIELSPDQTSLRVKKLENLPEFQPKKKNQNANKDPENVNPYQNLEVIVYVISVDKEQPVPFRYIQEALLKTYNVHSPYVRYNKTEGNFVVNKKNFKEEDVQKVVDGGLKVGEAELKVAKASPEQLSEFWEKHGHHYNGIIDNLRKDFNKKAKEERRAIVKNKKIAFEFAGKPYDDINKLKSEFKNILCRNPNNVPLKEAEQAQVKELLGYHDNGEAKLKDIKHFVVDVHPKYMDTRCLFAVKTDGAREDFSVVKCIENIEKKYSE